LCNLPCPGDDDDRCGSLEKPSDNVYDFLDSELDEEINDFHNVFSEENDASDKRRQIMENL
jgi:hypothetical protein